ncbi:hypothetical protein AZE42_00342, partial [Rhizopogon vesiculosus]
VVPAVIDSNLLDVCNDEGRNLNKSAKCCPRHLPLATDRRTQVKYLSSAQTLTLHLAYHQVSLVLYKPLTPKARQNESIQPLAIDLLNPSQEHERRQHKLKRLVQSPNSYFMDVKCPGCFAITTVFSHAQSVVLCGSCASVLCQPTGGKARLTEGCSFRRKN